MRNDFEIMDVTCRDGSYVVKFQISTADEKHICQGVEELGYRYTEIGHGMGLGADRIKKWEALHTDEEYLKCAHDNLHKIKYGIFCIPGIAEIDDIKLAADYGCSFIRIGCNVEDIDQTEAYIKEAKKQGLSVASNYMKSYASTLNEFQNAVRKSEAWGSDLIYIVDSAGGMLPTDVERYFNAVRQISNIKTGFHGHDNIGMALANSLYAVELGIDFIDCSLQGLGRSAGNTSLEEFTICLQKMGCDLDIDEIKLLLLSKKYVYPLVRNRGINPIDVECGISGFHSSYLQDIHKVSAEYEVNPLMLIREYCKYDQVGMDIEKLKALAADLPQDSASGVLVDFSNYFGNEQ